MLFNSYEFIFVFLPLTLVLYLALGKVSRGSALAWLIVASLLFYMWWRPINLLILAIGVLFNVAILGVFKYANFAVDIANDVAGTELVLQRIILPLGLSFITFQKIAFLVDVAGGRIKSFTFRDFALFVMFFPQLIAGPIVHYRETIPQFHANEKMGPETYAAAITLFCFGLFKKVVLADGIAQYVTPIYEYAAAGGDPTFIQGWLAAVGFTLQIYFDFSGYSDMACGAALLFGVRLPLNFDSPLKATNIIDFWLRWHVTLTRFLTAYVYNPITLAITRSRAAKKLPLLRGHGSRLVAFLSVLVGPTLLTMFLSGVWHGAGYTFVIWGLMHGGYLIVNHAWRQYAAKSPATQTATGKLVSTVTGFALTFLAVAVAMVFFRAPDVGSALSVLAGMVGLNGVSLPAALVDLAPFPVTEMMVASGPVYMPQLVTGIGYLVLLFLIALTMPNSLEVLYNQKPVLHHPAAPKLAGVAQALTWAPTLPWMLFVSALAAIAVMKLSGESEFLYWQF